MHNSQVRVLRKADVRRLVGLSDRTIDRLEARGEFPRRFRLTAQLVGWRSGDVEEWIEQRATAGAN